MLSLRLGDGEYHTWQPAWGRCR